MSEMLGLAELVHSAVVLIVAFVLGTLIGAERHYRQRNAGLRTNVLVAVGAAAFVDIGMRLNGHAGAIQVVAYVVSGVGFLGAGVIMREGKEVRGLNTAATLWCSAAVGAFSGAELLGNAVLLAIVVLAGNTLLRPLVNAINRAPIDETSVEASYEVRVVVGTGDVMEGRDLLVETLQAAHYPVREVTVEQRGGAEAELAAALVSSSIETDEIDAVVAELERSSLIHQATWTARTAD